MMSLFEKKKKKHAFLFPTDVGVKKKQFEKSPVLNFKHAQLEIFS